MQDFLSLIPLGGVGDVTKNMYLYQYKDEVLIVDCGIGFADETMLGVDLLLPDISYLLQSKKKIAGMVITHGHEDHMGALPFILPQISQQFPIYASRLTAALANEKLKEFAVPTRVEVVPFGKTTQIGSFSATFIPVTHSVPDTSHIFITTPVGNFYHGSDFKFDDTPYDGKKSDYEMIKRLSSQGVLCLLSDCLGAEREGRTGSEKDILSHFQDAIAKSKGKCIITTYSSHMARLNQIIEATRNANRHISFVGRSLIKTKDVGKREGYLHLPSELDVPIDQIKNYPDNQLVLVVAGTQGQQESAMVRMANNQHKDVKINEEDTVIFSADPIPGNEVLVHELIDTLARRGATVLYPPVSHAFHVSGHGSQEELSQLMQLTKPKHIIPIGGQFRHMTAYRNMAISQGVSKNNILLLDDGQEVMFSRNEAGLGKKIPVKNVYVDEVSGEEVEHYVLRDRQKLSEGGIVIVLCEIDSGNGQLVGKPEVIIRGFSPDVARLSQRIFKDISTALSQKKDRVTNWVYIRKLIGQITERRIYRDIRREPLVLPVVIEV
ncbi:MAG TPA: ribonuclease J [Candidatus Saccharimonadales bacterium]|nr:ribonuclease J [Candidatus Saccharimonadales bacterium]